MNVVTIIRIDGLFGFATYVELNVVILYKILRNCATNQPTFWYK